MISLLKFQQNKLDNALRDLNYAIQIDPNLIITYIYRGDLYLKQNQFKLALAEANLAIKMNPFDPLPYQNRGLIAIELKNLAKAERNLKKYKSIAHSGFSSDYL